MVIVAHISPRVLLGGVAGTLPFFIGIMERGYTAVLPGERIQNSDGLAANSYSWVQHMDSPDPMNAPISHDTISFFLQKQNDVYHCTNINQSGDESAWSPSSYYPSNHYSDVIESENDCNRASFPSFFRPQAKSGELIRYDESCPSVDGLLNENLTINISSPLETQNKNSSLSCFWCWLQQMSIICQQFCDKSLEFGQLVLSILPPVLRCPPRIMRRHFFSTQQGDVAGEQTSRCWFRTKPVAPFAG